MIVRAATPGDVPAIAALVAVHARRGDLLPRDPAAIRSSLADWLVAESDGRVVGCGSLVHYGPALAELRSLAVSGKHRGNGAGGRIVAGLVHLAARQYVPRLFTLTRAVAFFERQGFAVSDKHYFPEKVWRDCLGCPVLDHCDETAMELSVVAAVANPRGQVAVRRAGGGAPAPGGPPPPARPTPV